MTDILPRAFEKPDLTDLPPLPQCIDQIHPEFFAGVTASPEFPDWDMMDFVDMEPKAPNDEIAQAFQAERRRLGDRFSYKTFQEQYFTRPTRKNGAAILHSGPGDDKSYDEHAYAVLESHLGYAVDSPTTIGAPNLVSESGGRYSRADPGRAVSYGWDQEPAVYGFDALGEHATAAGLVDNNRAQIDRWKRGPFNGTALQYMGRRQVTVTARLVRRDVQYEGSSAYERHLEPMLIEYYSIMEGADDETKLPMIAGSRYQSVVRMPDMSVLNVFSAKNFTYADGTARPAPESRKVVLETKRKREEMLGRELTDEEYVQFCEEDHAARGAGTDFADWMLENGTDLATNRTTKRVPPFYNAAIFELECEIAAAFRYMRNEPAAELFEEKAMRRAASMRRFNYDPELKFFIPWDIETGPVRDMHLQDATFLLESGIPSYSEGYSIGRVLDTRFLALGGFLASLRKSKQSWSYINVWPNVQRGGIKGAWLYGLTRLEEEACEANLLNIQTGLQDPKCGHGRERYRATALGKPGVWGEYTPPGNFTWASATEVDLRHKAYRNEFERLAWLRRRQIADGIGRLAIPS